jgi:hypothetical protein
MRFGISENKRIVDPPDRWFVHRAFGSGCVADCLSEFAGDRE